MYKRQTITSLAHRGRGAEHIDLGAVDLVRRKLFVYVVDGTNTCGFYSFPASRWGDVLARLYSLKVGRRGLRGLLLRGLLLLGSLRLSALGLGTGLSFWGGAARNGGLGARGYVDVGIVVKRFKGRVGVLE